MGQYPIASHLEISFREHQRVQQGQPVSQSSLLSRSSQSSRSSRSSQSSQSSQSVGESGDDQGATQVNDKPLFSSNQTEARRLSIEHTVALLYFLHGVFNSYQNTVYQDILLTNQFDSSRVEHSFSKHIKTTFRKVTGPLP